MVTDRVGPTITTLKAEVDYLDGEVKKLLNLLADARTESMKLRAALELYRDAVRIDATMEGPKFMGANSSALKRAWDADRAALGEQQ